MDHQALNVSSNTDDNDYFRDLALDLHHLHREDDPTVLPHKLHAFMTKHSNLSPDHVNHVIRGLFDKSNQRAHGTNFSDGGEVEGEFARGGMTPIHPALNIPGVHIRTAEAGEPIFHGEK